MSSTASANVADLNAKLNAKLNAELKRADEMIQRLNKFIAEKPPLCPDAFREDFEHVRRKLEIDAEKLSDAELDAAMTDEVKTYNAFRQRYPDLKKCIAHDDHGEIELFDLEGLDEHFNAMTPDAK